MGLFVGGGGEEVKRPICFFWFYVSVDDWCLRWGCGWEGGGEVVPVGGGGGGGG